MTLGASQIQSSYFTRVGRGVALCIFSMFPQTSESFWSEMVRLNKNKKLRKSSAYAFDAAWMIALTLDAALANGMKYENLLQRTYKEVRLIRKFFENTNFQGITVSKINIIRGLGWRFLFSLVYQRFPWILLMSLHIKLFGIEILT